MEKGALVNDMQQQEQGLAPHAAEVARALQGKLSEEQVFAELAKYVEYGVPLAQAKREIVRNHGGTPGRKKVNELVAGEPSVDVVGRLLSSNPKEITVQGEKKAIFYGLLGDETGTVPYTAWKDFALAKGQTVHVRNAYVTEWRDAPQLNLGDRAGVEPWPEPVVVLPLASRATERKVAELRGGQSSVAVVVRVTRLEGKQLPDGRSIVAGDLADETGKVRFTAWKDPALEAGGVYRMTGAYVKAWKGMPDLNLGDACIVERLPDESLPPADELGVRVIPIHELDRIGGGTDVQVCGVVAEVREGSGLILRCPECNRAMQKRECRVHGKVEGIADLRIKAVVDDGTGALTAYLGKDVTEALLGLTLEKCQLMAKEAMSQDVVQEEIEGRVVARRLRVRGNATSDDFGLMLIATRAELAQPADVRAEAERLREALEQEVG